MNPWHDAGIKCTERVQVQLDAFLIFPKKNLCFRQDELASSQIALHVKISEHIQNAPVPTVLDTCKLSCNFLALCASMALRCTPSFLYFRPYRARVGVLLCSRKWHMCSHITHLLCGDHALQVAIHELHGINCKKCHCFGTNKKVKKLPIKS